jgi:hypothetical protein
MILDSPIISGSSTVTGNLTVLGTLTASVSGSVTSASYATNAETLDGLDSTSFTSTSSFNTASGSFSTRITSNEGSITSLTQNVASLFATSASLNSRVNNLDSYTSSLNSKTGSFATTGSNNFNGNQIITGSLTTTGTITAQTLNVQQVTSSIVYSSGSNIFGNSVSNTQQFTGSLQVSGSTSYILGNVGIGTTSPTRLVEIYGASLSSDTPTLRISSADSSGTRKFGIEFYSRTGADVRGKILADNGGRLYIDDNGGGGVLLQANGGTGNVGIGTTNPGRSVHILGATGIGTVLKLEGAAGTTTYLQLSYNGATNIQSGYIGYDSSANMPFFTNNTEHMRITSGGNIGIGTTDTQTFRLAVDGPNVGQGDTSTTIRVFDTTSATTGTGGGISFAGYFSGTSSIINTFSYIKGGKENSTNSDYASYLSFGTRVNGGSVTERMRISSTGAATFSSSVRATGILISDDRLYMPGNRPISDWFSSSLTIGYSSSNSYGWVNGAGNLVLGTEGVERMRITSTGLVGIGTTSPLYKLDVNGITSISTSNTSLNSQNSAFYFNNTYPSNYALASISYGTEGQFYYGYLAFNTVTTGFANVFTERMRITQAGDIGIGTTSPRAILSVEQDYAATAEFGSQGQLSISGKTNPEKRLSMGFNTSADVGFIQAMINGTSYNTLLLNARGGTVYVNASSNPTPGNAAPQFGVVGAAGTDAVNIKHDQDANNTINIWQIGTTSHNAIAFYKGNTQTNRGLITVTTSGTTYNTVSDYRLKENVTPLENGLDRVLQLKPSKFNWIETGNESEGFIAHELQEYFPDAVTGEKDAVYSSTGNIKPQSVDYGRITPLLVKAIQELKAENDKLKEILQRNNIQ